jgi:hypothetical protein
MGFQNNKEVRHFIIFVHMRMNGGFVSFKAIKLSWRRNLVLLAFSLLGVDLH